ncbi:MAG TPA: Gfo/Idh/MocA family oxidoreductase [Sedimentisphaerales bacterium]|nr:Gfo/Idh/MocA family oxidoreductase [Sedimentisphaerales bacterium]HOV76658.1 Gfo/Idh/MocA family oxidoreductase [Sedimentisphaerales bacterium]
MDRRQFLRATAAGAALSTLGSYVPLYAQTKTRRVGLIGTGWYGKSALFRLLQIEPVEVVAVCDVDKRMVTEAAEMIAARQKSKKTPRTFGDWREMLQQEQFDIVHIATPDHWHALPMIAACKAGADIYVEKPVSVDVVEAQAMLAAARKYKRVVQVNMQRRSTPHLIEAKERVIQEGRLGKIAYVEICCYYHMRNRGNPAPTTPPAHLDYEMWTGPAPMLPYTPIQHPRGWRAFMEYSNGIVGDMCVHMLDMVRWLLDLGPVTRVSSSGGILVDPNSRATISDTQTATFNFGDLPVVWTHRTWGGAPDPEFPWAGFIYGDKGTLKADVHKYKFIPQGQGQPLEGKALYEYDKYPEDETERDLERHVAAPMRRHWRNLLDCIETRNDPVSSIEQGAITATACILANMACKLGRSLAWDADQGRVVGDEEANRLLARPYRNPWVHPDPARV